MALLILSLPATMHCPFCGANDTKVIDSRLVAEGGKYAADASVWPAASASRRSKLPSWFCRV